MPYRTLPPREPKERLPFADAELLPVYAVVWLASLIRTTVAFGRHETFGREATLAAALVVALPLLSISSIASWRRSIR